MTLEQLVHAARQTTSVWNMQFTFADMGSGLQDAVNRLEKLEAAVKDLQAKAAPAASPPSPQPK